MRPIRWMGNTKKNLLDFPAEARQRLGYKLQLIQSGGLPTDTKAFKGVGSGVYEIALKYDKEAYRCVLALLLGEHIYVLHVFQKKSKKGIETPQQDIAIIQQRYREAKELASHES